MWVFESFEDAEIADRFENQRAKCPGKVGHLGNLEVRGLEKGNRATDPKEVSSRRRTIFTKTERRKDAPGPSAAGRVTPP